MTSREQFEAEMAKLGDVVDMRRAKNGDMGYMAWDVSLAWRMWQASREAVEVVLPPAINTEEIGRAISKERTMTRLALAGIKVKVE